MSSPSPAETPSGTNSTTTPPPPDETPLVPNATVSPPPPPDITSAAVSPPPPLAAAPSSLSGGGLSPATLSGIIIGAVLGAVSMLIVGGVFFCVYRNWKKKRSQNNYSQPSQPKVDMAGVSPTPDGKVGLPPKLTPVGLGNQKLSSSGLPTPTVNSSGTASSWDSEKVKPSPGISLALSQSSFTHDELVMATDGFSYSNLLGQGGFGYVHKGVLPNGKIVAVKQLKSESRQGEREFHAEVDVISRVHHRHLVSLVGYCISDNQKMLVYEYVPNNTLEFHLHGKDRPPMDWSTRMKIAIGSAKGLAYLHEDCNPKIIHRDIKASNILIDDSFEAKVADFGLAKFSSDTETHVSTRVMGTFGLDSSYARPLLSQAFENGNFDGLLDPKLQKNYNHDEMIRMAACAACCVRHSARLRPRMSQKFVTNSELWQTEIWRVLTSDNDKINNTEQVVRALEGNISLEDLNEGSAPGHSRVFGSFEGSSYDSVQYSEDMKNFRKLALESQEQGISEYSGPSSDYGRHPSVSTSSGQQNTQEIELGERER
ncbi:hypothetical protein V8G54_003614 [Vigna mungo]|uniref:non-specific serine/threonine protein kinase n=1 Tax=Vigna mungo TaxID=3915 RepID=A0AAQ3PDZ4_VIGMU